MEVNEPPPLLRSINNDHVSSVIFINGTWHEVEILWINYEGQAVSYGRLPPGGKQHITTYATHPWIFLEPRTMDRFLADGKDVFYPEPWFAKYPHLPRSEIPNLVRMVPDRVYISVPMYTLRDLALRVIKRLLYDDNDAYLLDIPKNLQRELASMEPRKNAAFRRLNSS